MLDGRLALVTGASRGIGHAIAEQLVKDGAKVIGTSTSEEGAKKVPGIGMVLDVRDPARTESVMNLVQKEHGDVAILVNNVDVAIVGEPDGIKDALVRQAASPVRWVETIRKMREMGVTHVIECGPGKVLAGMTKRIAPEVQSIAAAERATLEEALKC